MGEVDEFMCEVDEFMYEADGLFFNRKGINNETITAESVSNKSASKRKVSKGTINIYSCFLFCPPKSIHDLNALYVCKTNSKSLAKNIKIHLHFKSD